MSISLGKELRDGIFFYRARGTSKMQGHERGTHWISQPKFAIVITLTIFATSLQCATWCSFNGALTQKLRQYPKWTTFCNRFVTLPYARRDRGTRYLSGINMFHIAQIGRQLTNAITFSCDYRGGRGRLSHVCEHCELSYWPRTLLVAHDGRGINETVLLVLVLLQ